MRWGWGIFLAVFLLRAEHSTATFWGLVLDAGHSHVNVCSRPYSSVRLALVVSLTLVSLIVRRWLIIWQAIVVNLSLDTERTRLLGLHSHICEVQVLLDRLVPFQVRLTSPLRLTTFFPYPSFSPNPSFSIPPSPPLLLPPFFPSFSPIPLPPFLLPYPSFSLPGVSRTPIAR